MPLLPPVPWTNHAATRLKSAAEARNESSGGCGAEKRKGRNTGRSSRDLEVSHRARRAVSPPAHRTWEDVAVSGECAGGVGAVCLREG